MTLSQAITRCDQLQPNPYPDELKICWLQELDGQIYRELHQCCRDCPPEPPAYTPTQPQQPLLVPQPYAGDLYTSYLQACMDRENGEIARYNRSIALYNSAYLRYQNHYRRSHRPLNAGPFRLKGETPCPSTPL